MLKRKILAVVSSTTTLPSGKIAGFTLEELAAPYARFARAGFEIEIASPLGGKVSHDPAYADGPFLTAEGQAFLDDPVAQAKLAHSIALRDIDPDEYVGIYLVGGVTAAADFDANPDLDHVLTLMLGAGKGIAAVCHGVVGLTNLRGKDGKLLARGHRMTGFSEAEEIAADLLCEVSVIPEHRLNDIGAHYEKASELWEECVIEGPFFITGQNPASSAGVAEALLRRLAL